MFEKRENSYNKSNFVGLFLKILSKKQPHVSDSDRQLPNSKVTVDEILKTEDKLKKKTT